MQVTSRSYFISLFHYDSHLSLYLAMCSLIRPSQVSRLCDSRVHDKWTSECIHKEPVTRLLLFRSNDATVQSKEIRPSGHFVSSVTTWQKRCSVHTVCHVRRITVTCTWNYKKWETKVTSESRNKERTTSPMLQSIEWMNTFTSLNSNLSYNWCSR